MIDVHKGIRNVHRKLAWKLPPTWKNPLAIGGAVLGGSLLGGYGTYRGTKSYLENNMSRHVDEGMNSLANSFLKSEPVRQLKRTFMTVGGGALGASLGKEFANAPLSGMTLGGSVGYGLGGRI